MHASDIDAELHPVLAAYPPQLQPRRVEALGGAGGFSGARFWRLHAPAGVLCLRRWPREHPSADKLRFIHDVLRHAADRGFVKVPVPIAATSGATSVHASGHSWEVSPWMPGRPHDFIAQPDDAKRRAAMRTLAEFHVAGADHRLAGEESTSPGLLQRLKRIEHLRSGDIDRLNRAVSPGVWKAGCSMSRRLCELFPRAAETVEQLVRSGLRISVRLQPCLRDIWSDHVLFEGDEVTGVIDFGAAGMESVAADVARLLGSIAGDYEAARQTALDAYESVRSLTPGEHRLIRAFDASTVLLAGLSWVDWIYVQERQFEGLDRVAARMATFVERLENLAKRETV